MPTVPPSPKVARFRPNPPADDPAYSAVPDDGLCLNTFLLLRDAPSSRRVLLGRIDPTKDWETIGGMHRKRIEALGNRWMLPSRQLRIFEGPHEAAGTIAREQLEIEELALDLPQVTSEAWERGEPAGGGRHWDLSFLFRGVWPAGAPIAAAPWRELAFLDPARLAPSEVGRSHLDVLAMAGYPTGASGPVPNAGQPQDRATPARGVATIK